VAGSCYWSSTTRKRAGNFSFLAGLSLVIRIRRRNQHHRRQSHSLRRLVYPDCQLLQLQNIHAVKYTSIHPSVQRTLPSSHFPSRSIQSTSTPPKVVKMAMTTKDRAVYRADDMQDHGLLSERDRRKLVEVIYHLMQHCSSSWTSTTNILLAIPSRGAERTRRVGRRLRKGRKISLWRSTLPSKPAVYPGLYLDAHHLFFIHAHPSSMASNCLPSGFSLLLSPPNARLDKTGCQAAGQEASPSQRHPDSGRRRQKRWRSGTLDKRDGGSCGMVCVCRHPDPFCI